MAEFSKLVITNKGQALIAKMIAGEGNIDFTKISTSSTQYQLTQLEALTALTGVKQTSLISKVTGQTMLQSRLKRRSLIQI